MQIQSTTKEELLNVIENEANIKIDRVIESAIELAEEVHSDVKREDGKSSFLETHIWPVTIGVIRHYIENNKYLSTLQICSAISHDIMEDNEKIMDLYAAKSYGFDAYFKHRLGDYVYNVAMILKTQPLENYSGENDEEKQISRFFEYCTSLTQSDYDVKLIKLLDRLNNMQFISQIPGQEKIKRYLREAEDFYIAFSIMMNPEKKFYHQMREAYDELKSIKVTV